MIKLNIHEIKAQFSKYIDLVEAGETVVVCKRNIPVAELRPVTLEKAAHTKQKRVVQFGLPPGMKGKFEIPDDFNEMSEEELRLWEGAADDPLRKYAPKLKKRRR